MPRSHRVGLGRVRVGVVLDELGDDLTDKFIALPWTEEDGKAFPDGAHVALTHWYADPDTLEDQQGIWQYCDAPSGEVVAQFVEDYPYTDSPEPNAM